MTKETSTMRSYIYSLTIIILVMVKSSCHQKTYQYDTLTQGDSIIVIQTVLNDKELMKDVHKSFDNEQFKLIANKVIKDNFQLWFSDQPVRIVHELGDSQQIYLKYPKQLYVSIPMLKLIKPDTAQLSMVFHAGQGTVLFSLKKLKSNKWIIYARQYGKI